MVNFPGINYFLQNHDDFHVLGPTDYWELKPYDVNGLHHSERLRNCGGNQVIVAHGNSDMDHSGAYGHKIQSFRQPKEKK